MNDTRSAMRTRFLLPLVLAAVVTLGGCGGGGGGSGDDGEARPSTTVQVKIVEPTASQVTGPDVTVRVELVGGTVVARTTGDPKKTPTEGHVHLLVDGKTVSMAYQDVDVVRGLAPGPHTLLAEFVAVDHGPFRNRPTASVIFTVGG